ncbi:DNA recombination protein RmuC [Polaribacter pacificus]|uniref:DNA recombination protein RmuC n=1 Tax=Polaribacter pacificus TaxID=1775173 RepID=A0A917ME14_9FLAO|nr:DNA recombination protein RmuC [Polaribacter pacificus]GGG98604.1 DNA recombination protein RmuC [Polaribacter pacificus]
MQEFIIAIISVAIGGALGYYISKLKVEKTRAVLVSEKNSLEKLLQQSETEKQNIRLEKDALAINNATKTEEHKNLERQLAENKLEVEKLQEKFTKEFENLANKIFDEKSTKFTHQNKENIQNILNPLKEKIDGFEKKVAESQKDSVGMHAALKEQLSGLKELNLQMSKEALNLTRALKGDSKVQGDWGETQLEMLLEKANLAKGIHFETQGGFRDEEGRLKKPDFIVNLPDDRHLIIDAKVSLTAYEAYMSTEDEQEKEQHFKKHLESLRKHIKGLSEKKYDSLYEINTPDYVLMFVPIEPALMIALNKSNNLYYEALDKNVVLVSTSTLLATLSTVASMWRQENQKRNVLAIAEQAGRLYDQFVNLTDDLIKVGNQLKTVQGSYDTSMKKLTGKGNLITKVERIRELGAKTSKSLNKNLLDRAKETE